MYLVAEILVTHFVTLPNRHIALALVNFPLAVTGVERYLLVFVAGEETLKTELLIELDERMLIEVCHLMGPCLGEFSR